MYTYCIIKLPIEITKKLFRLCSCVLRHKQSLLVCDLESPVNDSYTLRQSELTLKQRYNLDTFFFCSSEGREETTKDEEKGIDSTTRVIDLSTRDDHFAARLCSSQCLQLVIASSLHFHHDNVNRQGCRVAIAVATSTHHPGTFGITAAARNSTSHD